LTTHHNGSVKLTLYRKWLTQKSTIGELYVNGAFFCYTLEDCVRTVKIKHETAIPTGTYEVVLNFSNRFQKVMPLLIGVPNFSGIRIHSGNTDTDTSGCILVGRDYSTDSVSDSRLAYNDLFHVLAKAAVEGKIEIEIVNPPSRTEQATHNPLLATAPQIQPLPLPEPRQTGIVSVPPADTIPEAPSQLSIAQRAMDALFGSGKIETQWAALALVAIPLWNELSETLAANGVQLPQSKGQWLGLLVAIGRLLVLRLKK
jgi:hypothetical protein